MATGVTPAVAWTTCCSPWSVDDRGSTFLLVRAFAQKPPTGRGTLNPGEGLVLLRLDTAALMGYTGAVFQSFFGSAWGVVISTVSLLFWTVVPMLLGLRAFRRKNF